MTAFREVTIAGALAAVCNEVAAAKTERSWPSPEWLSKGPEAFARKVFGLKKFWKGQRAIFDAVTSNKNVTIRSGHKCGKTLALAIVALWWFCCQAEAVVALAAPGESQLNKTLYREIKKLLRLADRRGWKIADPRDISVGVRRGVRCVDPDGTERVLFGVIATKAEGAAGVSGSKVLLIVDEASGVRDAFFEAFGTSNASDGSEGVEVKRVYISNPTRTTGEFARSHRSPKSEFFKVHLSSEETPNALGDVEGSIPGLAGPGWLEQIARVYGKDSAYYKVRAKGEFVVGEDGKILSEKLLEDAESRWLDFSRIGNDKRLGRLFIGVDPAGPGQGGDRSGFAVRRGQMAFEVYGKKGLSAEAHLTEVRALCQRYRHKHGELPPVVIVDRDGSVGADVYAVLRAYARAHPTEMQVFGFRGSEGARRWPDLYMLARDELYASGYRWFFEGGAIPHDESLHDELHFPEWHSDKSGAHLFATPKKMFREELERSPDLADALLLAVWEPRIVRRDAVTDREWRDEKEAPRVESMLAEVDAAAPPARPQKAPPAKRKAPTPQPSGAATPYGGSVYRGRRR